MLGSWALGLICDEATIVLVSWQAGILVCCLTAFYLGLVCKLTLAFFQEWTYDPEKPYSLSHSEQILFSDMAHVRVAAGGGKRGA